MVSQFDPELAKPLIQHLLDAENPDSSDPNWQLFLRYEQWMMEDARLRARYKSSLGADKGIQLQEAQRMWEIGRLEAESEEFMLVHTKDALRMFIGRGADPDGKIARIPGAKNVATALRQMWIESGRDNPYADWALLMAEEALDARIASVEEARGNALKQIKELETRGLHISLLKSQHPVKVDLGFRSPYGFLIAHLIVAFDEFVRAVKTLQSRDLISSDDARQEIRSVLRPTRALFDVVLRQQTILARPTFASIKRTDFSSKSADVQKRVTEIAALWPGLPEEILRGNLMPRHARRAQVRSTEQDDEADSGLL
ncbi:MAG: TIGR03761 family integrating conjugative element protein [Thauera sp.]|jgi:integrating conjugative element protein (TIGR03761 family)|nr:TIGR03761 family integrating conjugative element protein [Thauera sp.]